MTDLSKWKNVYSKYKYDGGKHIAQRIAAKGYIATPEDIDIINEIMLWKLNRSVSIPNELIEYINSVAKKINSPLEAIKNKDVFDLIDSLLKCKGIRLPMASTILHFYQCKAFPIIDERAFRQAEGKLLPTNATANIYIDYISRCYELSQQYKIPFEIIDKILYQIDIEEGNTLKK